MSLKEEDLIFKENKLNIGHAFRKKTNFDNNNQYQQNSRIMNNGMNNGMNGGAGNQHHMMAGNNSNIGHLGLGGHGGMGLHNGGMATNGLGNMGSLGGLGGLGGAGHLGNNNYLDSQMNGAPSGLHPMNNMNGFGSGSQGMSHNGMGYGMNGHISAIGGGMGGLTGMNGMNMN